MARKRVTSTGLAMLAGIVIVLGAQTRSTGIAPAAFELPVPSGRDPIATTTWHLTDTARGESFAEPGVSREVEVHAWYPAAARRRGDLAPYLRDGLPEARAFATLLRSPDAYDGLADVRTHAEMNGALQPGTAKFPLLVFSHGYTAVSSAYTALLEDLASHGYVVLSIVHPYEAAAATLSDRRVVSLLDESGAPRKGIRDVLEEWAREDETIAAVTRAADEAERLRLLRAYLSGLHHTELAVRRWVDDTKLVLDRLNTMPRTAVAGQLGARVDMNRVGMFGHSMGGVVTGQFCVEDRRCRAGLNLDGIPQYGTMIDKPFQRPFLMVYSARPGRAGASDAIYQRAASPYYRVDVRETLHLEFSDMPFWGGPLRERGAFGAIAPARASEITAAIVRAFFDQTLLGKLAPLLTGQSPFPEVTVRKP
jgi:predicted dienelactone hydrolase